MFRLTRQVRFAVNVDEDDQFSRRPTNSHGGYPSLTGLGHYFQLDVTLAGDLDARSSYLRNIKEIDAAVRRDAVPVVEAYVRRNRFGGGGNMIPILFDRLGAAWPGASLARLALSLSPTLKWSGRASEMPMVRLSQKFEFSASHRLHNPALDEAANVKTFGKCNNPAGHGHNYEVQVTLAGKPDRNGVLIDVPKFEETVATTVIDRFDHKHLNAELPEFRELIPTVENIAMVIFRLLKPKFAGGDTKLAGVTVWETPKTWCEYSE